MGWTGKTNYTGCQHLTFTTEAAAELCRTEFNSGGYEVQCVQLNKAQDKWSHNIINTVIKHPKGHNFGMVVLVDIKDDEILWKEIDESQGPAEDKYPVEFLDVLPKPKSDYAIDWHKRVRKNNFSINRFNLEWVGPSNFN